MKKRFLSLILTVSMVASCVMTTTAEPATEVDLTDGLIGEYLFDGNWGDEVTDKVAVPLDIYGDDVHEGTADDADPVLSTDATRGNIVELMGTWNRSGYLQLDNSYVKNLTDGFTVSMWAKSGNSKATLYPEADPNTYTTHNDMTFFNVQLGGGFAAIMGCTTSPWINDANGDWVDRVEPLANNIPSDVWVNVTVTLDAVNDKILTYKDGVLVNTTDALGGGSVAGLFATINNANDAEIQIGNVTPWFADALWATRACIDDLRMYNRVLSADEVAALTEVSADTSVLPINTIGAQTKDNDNTVLGFVTTVSKDIDLNDVEEMGVILKNSATASKSEMILENVTADGAIRKITTSYVTDLDVLDDSRSDSMYAFRSVITGITDISKSYTAVPYIEYKDGTVVYGSMVTRSIDDVN